MTKNIRIQSSLQDGVTVTSVFCNYTVKINDHELPKGVALERKVG